MKQVPVCALTAVVCLRASTITIGAEPPPAGASTAVPDKWQYTLFNPVPADQLRDMDTDRPNKTNTPHTIDAGHLQLETGIMDYSYYRDHYQNADARFETWDIGQFNLRVGVVNNVELNAAFNAYSFLHARDFHAHHTTRQNGIGDLVVGGKLNLWGNDGADGVWATALGIQPQLKIATAREALGNGHAECAVGLPLLVNLPAEFHLGLQTTPAWERSFNNTGYVTGWQNSVSVDRAIWDKLDVYLEYWSHVTSERGQQAQQTLDLGATYPLTKDVVLDTGFNVGLSKASPTFEWVLGISIRI